MPVERATIPAGRMHAPSMTESYSRVSDTARAVDRAVLPRVVACLESQRRAIARMPAPTPYVIADYGAADGANSGRLFERLVAYLREIRPSLRIRLVYVDIADPSPFERFWEDSSLSGEVGLEAEYLRRSFYGPIPELAGSVNLAYSSTALHWLDTRTGADLFRHAECIQANQLPEEERETFAEKWRRDWRAFFAERSRELVAGGALVLAALTSLGGDQWPASGGYDHLRDVCCSLHRDGRISEDDLRAVFVPDYFATPGEMRALLDEDAVRERFSLAFLEAMTVPCAYSARALGRLEGADERRRLARSLALVVRAWSESSVRAGLPPGDAGLLDEVYRRLEDRFFEEPRALPYQYCLVGLARRDAGSDEGPGGGRSRPRGSA